MEGASPSTPDFGRVAEAYDRLRPVDGNWWELFELLVCEGALLGQRVLDVGCGTGAFVAALAGRGARVWGVDPTPEMLARAREVVGRAGGLKQGRAEELPFKDVWFDRVVFRLVLHLVDRPRALAEAFRVLAPGGRVVAASFAPEHFDSYWLNAFFPRLLAIDRARFPSAEALAAELSRAGFAPGRPRSLRQQATLGREDALERVRGRYISTLRLLDDAEFSAGLERVERELPDTVETTIDWVVLAADRPREAGARLRS